MKVSYTTKSSTSQALQHPPSNTVEKLNMVFDFFLSDPRLPLLSIPAVWVLSLAPAFLKVRLLLIMLLIIIYSPSRLSERYHWNVCGVGQVSVHISTFCVVVTMVTCTPESVNPRSNIERVTDEELARRVNRMNGAHQVSTFSFCFCIC
jgi:hypothetical protein